MAQTGHIVDFPPYQLDLEAERLRRGDQAIDLRPKMWQLLRYLAERPGKLVTKQELMDEVWADVTVTIASLNQTVGELRRALGDDARNPRIIETVHRRGYRFIAPIADPSAAETSTVLSPPMAARPGESPLMIGREPEMEEVWGLLAEAAKGRRQLVFITGEPGIGKSTLLESFLAGLEAGDASRFVGGGWCVELLGEGEAYLPVLDALDRLARGPRGEPLRLALQRFAPTWRAQLPWLEDPADGAVQPVAGSPTRMLREFCVAIEALCQQRPTILWLEDLHWSDHSTVDLVAALARRTEPARLVVVATYRPVDAAIKDHPIGPLKNTLLQQGLCREIALEMLNDRQVQEYFSRRLGAFDHGPELARIIHDHTDGNPLFVKTMVDHAIARGWLEESDGRWRLNASLEAVQAELPHSLRDIVDSQLKDLSDKEISFLEAGSVAGETFAAQAVSAAADVPVEDAEAVGERLARWGRFLQTSGAARWPDGSSGQSFQFQHQVFRTILYSRLPPARRQKLHQQLARGFESSHPELRGGMAAEIAHHFERGGEAERAIDYLAAAAEGVVRRFADREAVSYLHRALDLLESLPPSPNRDRRECDLRRQLARALVHAGGYAVPEQVANTDRLMVLGASIDDAEAQLVGLAYRQDMHLADGDVDQVRHWAQKSKGLATDATNPILMGHLNSAQGLEAGLRGENRRALEHCEQGRTILMNFEPQEVSAILNFDLAVFDSAFLGWAAWMLGRPEQAQTHTNAAFERAAMAGATPFDIAISLTFALPVEQFRRDREAAREILRKLAACLGEFGLPWPYAFPAAAEGWLRAAEGEAAENIARMSAAAAEVQAGGATMSMSLLYATIAEAELRRGRAEAGFEALDEAMLWVERHGERFWEAEIHRLRGELQRIDGDDRKAEASFRKSLDISRAQDALSLELRAAISLTGMALGTDREAEARAGLAAVYDRFEEGFDTADLLEAKALLDG